MTFKDELVKRIIDNRLVELELNLKALYQRRYYRIDVEPGIDFKRKCIFGYQLLEPGQKIWDKLVELGFSPQFNPCSDEWSGGPHISVRW